MNCGKRDVPAFADGIRKSIEICVAKYNQKRTTPKGKETRVLSGTDSGMSRKNLTAGRGI